ncbi:MAG TPA: ParB/RepB/Spo0J family partition protein [Candidatus Ornithoclostridium faecavium]|nr:ParB/RepB/Spo0J family partition protein [Candidatus Ornithoclostridium faecavium]
MAKKSEDRSTIDLALKLANDDTKGEAVTQIESKLIDTNPNQPRKHFDEDALNELAVSIKNYGVIQPILVCPKEGGRYELIAGERRLRASKMAGLSFIPAIVKRFTESEMAEIALIENLQREDLNPIEEARAYRSLMEKYGFTQEELADKLGKSRPVIANSLRLLSLNPVVVEMVETGRLSAGHARCLASIKDMGVQATYALAACDKQLSVRQLENMVRAYLKPGKEPKTPKKAFISPELKELVNNMQRTFGTKVKAVGNNEKGRIFIDYYTKDDLIRIYELIDTLSEQE